MEAIESEVVLATPFSEPVITAVELLAPIAACAVKVAEALPAGIVTDAGTVSTGLLSEIATVIAPAAKPDKATVQAEDAPAPMELGLQINELSVGVLPTIVIAAAAEALIGSAAPPVDADASSPSEIGREESADDRDGTTVTVATAPLPTTLLFIPQTAQRIRPVATLHETDLPAAVAAGPAETVTDEKSADWKTRAN